MITILVTLAIIGVLLYLVNAVIPMDPKIKLIINVLAILAVCLWLLDAFGLIDVAALRRHR
jgi:hypothetical protein